MTELPPLRIGIAGLGGHGRSIQDAVAAVPALCVGAVYDPDEGEARAAADRFGCPAAPSFDALLAHVDAVVLVTPNALHRAQTQAAVAAGLDVFVEKPIANTVADGRAMVEAAEAAGRTLMVGHNMRFGAAMRWGREMIAAGRLGEVVSVEVHFSSDTGLRLSNASWRLRPDQCPLLPMMQLGIHGVDLIHYLVGPIQSVFARARAVTTTGGVVDSVVAAFDLTDGALGTMVSNYCTPVDFRVHIAGTEGALGGTPAVLSFTPRADGEPETHDASADGYASYAAQMQAFADAVRGRTEPETHGWAGTQALAVVEAMADSIARAASVEVPLLRPHALDHAS